MASSVVTLGSFDAEFPLKPDSVVWTQALPAFVVLWHPRGRVFSYRRDPAVRYDFDVIRNNSCVIFIAAQKPGYTLRGTELREWTASVRARDQYINKFYYPCSIEEVRARDPLRDVCVNGGEMLPQ